MSSIAIVAGTCAALAVFAWLNRLAQQRKADDARFDLPPGHPDSIPAPLEPAQQTALAALDFTPDVAP
jgi:hypothetical protein